jgi:hypothetical protein
MRFEKHHSPEGGWDDDAMRRFVRDNSLSIVTVGAFLVIWLGGQAWRLCAAHRLARAEGIGRVQTTPG